VAVKKEQIFNTFVKGLVTEASALTFPENSSVDEENFVLNRDGSRSRRLGLDYEELHTLTSTGFTSAQLRDGKQSFHTWQAPAGDTTVSIGVVRVNNKLWFMNMLTANPSSNLLNSGSPLTLGSLNNADIETTAINNKLIIVSKDLAKPVVLSYDKSSKAVSSSDITIEIRDIYGVNDGLLDNIRPVTLTQTHKYNLRNQGWNESIVTGSSSYPDALLYTKQELGVFPSNADVWTLGKKSNPSGDDYEKYDPDTLEKNSTSIFPVSRGSFIIDAFNRGNARMGLSDATGLPTDQETGAISSVASYAQRLFYSGITSNVSGADSKSPNYSGYVFFSKVITSDNDFGKCHQEADPTDPSINDLIDSDGGSIQIPEATRIIKIVASQSSLIVFAENGVWEIYGDTGGFVATSFQASKISTNGILNGDSVVNVNGQFIYWSKAGIYALSSDAIAGRYKAESISLTSIQSLFLAIPDVGKNNCKGFYDEKENRVRWLYNDTANYSAVNFINKYNKELILDLSLQAWYKNSITDLALASPYVCDYIEVPGYAIANADVSVEAGAQDVIITTSGSANPVVITEKVETSRSSLFSFLTIVGTSFTISKYNSRRFLEWYSKDTTGINYSSFLITGYELFKDIMRDKQIPYIFFYFNKTEDGFTAAGSGAGAHFILNNESSCRVQAQWNWANSLASGRWGLEFQAYRLSRLYIPTGATDTFDTGEAVIVTKNKLRGTGKTLSLLIKSDQGKDMKILGWALSATANDVV
jgi:hypothetical protein|tara:strand:+ start:1735 stop:4008 length:2274 start_codon:yes stop_codon:yes gene_type:complete